MRAIFPLVAGLLFALPVLGKEQPIQVAPASDATIQLLAKSREDDPLDQAAKRAANDPWNRADTSRLLAAVRQRDEIALGKAFVSDMVRHAHPKNVMGTNLGLEYPPNYDAMPTFNEVIGPLTNAVQMANLPCGSIYAAEPLGSEFRGWALMCDGKANIYAITLVGRNWKLVVLKSVRSQARK